jgi:hypothetical protein
MALAAAVAVDQQAKTVLAQMLVVELRSLPGALAVTGKAALQTGPHCKAANLAQRVTQAAAVVAVAATGAAVLGGTATVHQETPAAVVALVM